MPTLASIGAGRMARAILLGLIKSGSLEAKDIRCLSGSGKTAEALAKETGCIHAGDLPSLLEGADVVLLACKPQHLNTLDPALAELTTGKLLVSVLAGKPLGILAKHFPKARNILWAMPNTPGRIGKGITPFCALKPLSHEDHIWSTTLLGALGSTQETTEAQMDAMMAISGCGPAFCFAFVDALAKAGERSGLDPAVALRLASKTFTGAAYLLEQSKQSPAALIEEVRSPQGVTHEGLKVLEEDGLEDLLYKVTQAAQQRAKELAAE